MHEMSIAWDLVAQLEDLAHANHLVRIDAVYIEAGVLRGIVPEALDMAFTETAHGTVAEGATLHLKVLAARARCKRCDLRFEPLIDDYRCPTCDVADVAMEVGDDITLASIEGQTNEE